MCVHLHLFVLVSEDQGATAKDKNLFSNISQLFLVDGFTIARSEGQCSPDGGGSGRKLLYVVSITDFQYSTSKPSEVETQRVSDLPPKEKDNLGRLAWSQSCSQSSEYSNGD